jgi:hypothetical protein
VSGQLQIKLPGFGGLIEGVSTLFISQNSTGSEVAEAIRSAAVVKDEISMRRYMLDASEVTAVMLPRSKASYGAGRAWDVTFHRLNSTGGVARTARNVPELIIDSRLASNSSVNAKWTVSTRRQGQASCQGDQPGAAWNLGFGGNVVRLLRATSSADDILTALRTLNVPGSSHPDFSVTKSNRLVHGGFTWTIQFPWHATTTGRQLTVEPWKPHSLNDLQCAMRSSPVVNATFGLRGTIGLSLGDHARSIAYIPANATAAQFANALQEAGNISSVRVSVDILQPSPPEGNDARRWRVTFTSFADAGDVPLLDVAELPDGTDAAVNVTEVVKGQSAPVARIDLVRGPGKTFTATYNGAESVTLSTNLTEEEYKVAFQDAFTSLSPLHQMENALGTTKARNPAYLDVQRDKTKLYVLFAKGDAAKLTVTGDAAVSVIRQASQTQILHDREELRGNFTLQFGLKCTTESASTVCQRAITTPLRIGANASEVEAALEALPEVVDVEVTRGLTRGAINGDVYAVTFRELRLHASRDAVSDNPRTWSREYSRLLYDPQTFTRDGGSSLPKIVGALTTPYGREFDGADIITRVVREGRTHQKGGVVAVEVATNGADFTSSGKTYAYVALPTVSGIRPPRGPMKGRTEVLVMGTGFFEIISTDVSLRRCA